MGIFPVLLSIGIISKMINSPCFTDTDNKTGNENSKNLIDNNKLNFTLELLLNTSQIEAKDNIFFSPQSIYEALTLTYFGSKGDTELLLKNVLNIPNKLSKIDVYRSYVHDKSFNFLRNYGFTTANRVYISSSKNVRQCMLEMFESELKKVDFVSNSSAVRTEIYNWMNETTKGQIQYSIQSDGIDETTDLIFVNAVYFQGSWKKPFFRNDSQIRPFFYGTNASNVIFMSQRSYFKCIDSLVLAAQVLQMPYKDENISMFVFVPAYSIRLSSLDDGINNLINRMKTEIGEKTLRQIFNNRMPLRNVRVNLPRFTIEKKLPMNLLLDKLGVGNLLKNNSANFRDFVENNLHLDYVIHEAKIKNEEDGTPAMVSPSSRVRNGNGVIVSLENRKIFTADHPFVYIIYDKSTQSVLFTGIYRSPVGTGGISTQSDDEYYTYLRKLTIKSSC